MSALLFRPGLAIALAVALLVVLTASQSVAYPVALLGVPTTVIALIGQNPFPPGAVAVFLFAWMVLAIVFGLIRDREALPARGLVSAPVVLSVALLALMAARLGNSPAPDYGSVKLRLFFAQNIALLVAGILVGRRRKDTELFVILALLASAVSATVLARGLAIGGLHTNVGGRYSLYEEESPIALGRDAATGLILAAWLVLSGSADWVRFAALSAIPVIAVALVASGSRGPVLGLTAGLLVLIALTFRQRRSRQRLLLVALAAVGAVLLASSLVPAQDVQRSLSFLLYGGGSDVSSNGRYYLWHVASEAFNGHQLLGLGTGAFASLGTGALYPHNIVLELAAELGVIGVLLGLGAVGAAGLRLLAAWWRAVGEDRAQAALVVALFTASLLNALVSSDVAGNKMLWLAMGLGVGISLRSDVVRRHSARTGWRRRAIAETSNP